MANTTNLQAAPPKREKLDPRAMIGGIFEDVLETITGVGTGYVNEGPVTRGELSGLLKSQEHKAGMPVRGSIEFNQRLQVLPQEINQISSARSKIDALQARRKEVNTKIGIGNTSYENPVREDFTLRVDVQTHLDRANSALSEKQLKATRERILATATGGKQKTGSFQMREGELFMGNERSGGGHWTNNPG